MIHSLQEKYLNTNRIWVVYLLWALLTFILFMFILFPSESLVYSLTERINKQVPGLNLQAENMTYAFPVGVKTKGISVEYMDVLYAEDLSLSLSPALFKLLTGKKNINYTCYFYENSVNGQIDIQDSLDNPTGSATIMANDVDISRIVPLKEILEREISGKLELNSRIDFKENRLEQAEIVSVLTDSEITLNNPMIPIKSVAFTRVDLNAGFSAKDGKVQLKTCTFAGPIINGTISGSLTPGNTIENSSLNITGTLKASHTFLAEMGKASGALQFISKESLLKGIDFTLKGTIKRPDFKIKQKK